MVILWNVLQQFIKQWRNESFLKDQFWQGNENPVIAFVDEEEFQITLEELGKVKRFILELDKLGANAFPEDINRMLWAIRRNQDDDDDPVSHLAAAIRLQLKLR